jgi:hypothetical protein
MPITPGTWEAEVGRSKSKAGPGKSISITKAEGWGGGSSGRALV